MAASMDDYLKAVQDFNKMAQGITAVVDALTASFDAALKHSAEIRAVLDASDASAKQSMRTLQQKCNSVLAKTWD